MGDMGDYYRDAKDHRKALRELHGVECPRCKAQRPKTCATILLPQQKCFDGYRDPRPRLTDEQQANVFVDLAEKRKP